MGDIEHPFTVEQYRAAMAEQDRLKAEKDEAQRQELMAKNEEERLRRQLAGAVEAIDATIAKIDRRLAEPRVRASALFLQALREDLDAARGGQ